MENKTKKYRIDDYLQGLTVKEYRHAINTIPELLGISLNTFHNYRKIMLGDIQDIPYECVVIMEKLFEFKPGSLITHDFNVKSLKEIFHKTTSSPKSDQLCNDTQL